MYRRKSRPRIKKQSKTKRTPWPALVALLLMICHFTGHLECAYVSISLSSTNIEVNGSLNITLLGFDPGSSNFDRLQVRSVRPGKAPLAIAKYLKNGSRLAVESSMPTYYVGRVNISNNISVVISPVIFADEKTIYDATYRYRSDGYTTVESAKFELQNVYEFPVFAYSLQSVITAIEGIPTQVSCIVKSRPASNITWSHDAEVVGVSTQNVKQDGGYFTTTGIFNITKPLNSMNAKTIICTGKAQFGASIQQNTTLNVVYRPKDTTFSVTPSNLTLNTNIQLTCSATGLPSARNYRFYVNDILIGNETDGKLTVNVSTSVCGNYIGEYKCIPESTIGDGEIKTTTRKFESSFITLNSSKAVNEGQDVTLYCSAEDCPTSVITWKKNGISLGGKTGNRLQLLSVKKNDTGEYSCHATFWNATKSANMTLTVNHKPDNIQFTTLTLKPQDGNRVILTCSSNGMPTPTYRIYKITGSSRTVIANSGLHLIRSISYVDYTGYKANFMCESKNTLGNATKEIQLDIQVKPILAVSSDTKVNKGGNVTFSCSITAANPVTTIIWKNPAKRLIQHSNGVVKINSVSSWQQGVYTCHAENSAGESTKTFILSFNAIGKPKKKSRVAERAGGLIGGMLAVILICVLAYFFLTEKRLHQQFQP